MMIDIETAAGSGGRMGTSLTVHFHSHSILVLYGCADGV